VVPIISVSFFFSYQCLFWWGAGMGTISLIAWNQTSLIGIYHPGKVLLEHWCLLYKCPDCWGGFSKP
jgi:hypothetical protein